MARIIQGIPDSWDPSVANTRFPSRISAIAWSPCSGLLAATNYVSSEIAILDAATLGLVYTIHPLEKAYTWTYIKFSPGGHVLTANSWMPDCIVSWDLQTGGLLSNIGTEGTCNSMTYSECEIMVASLFDNKTIMIHNISSGECMFSHSIASIVGTIWTCGEYLHFATQEQEVIQMWQVSFTSSHVPTKANSLSTPYNFSLEELVLLPNLPRLAFISHENVVVWDAQHHKVLLDSADVENPNSMTFSSDGHFFMCGTKGREFHVWKESPAGYLPYQKLASGVQGPIPLISPNAESVVTFGGNILQLWHMSSFHTSPPHISMQASQQGGRFFVEFSPDKSLVAVARWLSNTVNVLDIKSGSLWLDINTDIHICGLRITGDKVIVVGAKEVVAWDLPSRDCTFNTRKTFNDSVQTTAFINSAYADQLYASISPNLKHIAYVPGEYPRAMCIYNIQTREKIEVTTSNDIIPGFTPSGDVVWCARPGGEADEWEVVEDGSDVIGLKGLLTNTKPSSNLPWHSSCGYQVTDDGWVLCSSRKWLLWLPYHWQPDNKIEMKWNGKFLAVWNWNLPEPHILEFEV